MIKNPSKLKIYIYLLFVVLLIPKPAHAYLDPGTGSYIFQIAIAGLLASTFFMKSLYKKAREFIGNIFSKNTANSASVKKNEKKS